MPLALISVMASLRAVDPELESVSRTLGASASETAWRVTLPLIRPGILSGALFAFVTSFDEPVVAMFIAGNDLVTLPKRMWDGVQYEIDPTASAVATVLILMSISAVIIAGRVGAWRSLASGDANKRRSHTW
jgi:ABC-type spermidine/putrescine transport system permease subunit II